MKTTNSSRRSQPGFTLIELFIAVAIIGVLVAIALPAYRESIARSRRVDAQVALGGLAVAMERYYSSQTPATYAGATIGAGGIFPNQSPLDGARKFYTLSITLSPNTTTPTGFTLRATPIAGSGQQSDRCGTFTLASTGLRGLEIGGSAVPGSDTRIADCWR